MINEEQYHLGLINLAASRKLREDETEYLYRLMDLRREHMGEIIFTDSTPEAIIESAIPMVKGLAGKRARKFQKNFDDLLEVGLYYLTVVVNDCINKNKEITPKYLGMAVAGHMSRALYNDETVHPQAPQAGQYFSHQYTDPYIEVEGEILPSYEVEETLASQPALCYIDIVENISLTEREERVLKMAKISPNQKDLANMLGLSQPTISREIASIHSKIKELLHA